MSLAKLKCLLAHGVPVIMFVVLIATSALASVGSYCATLDVIRSDMRQALADTIAERRGYYAAADTIRTFSRLSGSSCGAVVVRLEDSAFRKHLSVSELRDKAFLELTILNAADRTQPSLPTDDEFLGTESVMLASAGDAMTVMLRGCSGCSRASVFAMSDQRMSLVLFAVAVFWALFTSVWRRKHIAARQAVVAFGGLTLSESGDSFFGPDGDVLHLTPMQHRLMMMFFTADGHRLSHNEICEALWPKKPDASDTLYTLVRRLRRVLEANSRLHIESDRGVAYRLTDR